MTTVNNQAPISFSPALINAKGRHPPDGASPLSAGQRPRRGSTQGWWEPSSSILSYVRASKARLRMELASELAYRGNFFLKLVAVALLDLLSPLVALLIYETTSGIPGWSFAEFILFTGTFTLIAGLGRALFVGIPFEVIDSVRDGTFDKILLLPYKPLKYLSFTGFDLNGIPEMLVGLCLVAWSAGQLSIGLGPHVAAYALFVALGVAFQYAVYIIISALAFLVVRSWALFEIWESMQKFARYPLNVYGHGLQIALTFFVPIAISAHVPAKALLGAFSLAGLLSVALPVAAFVVLAAFLWEQAMRKYSSAGG